MKRTQKKNRILKVIAILLIIFAITVMSFVNHINAQNITIRKLKTLVIKQEVMYYKREQAHKEELQKLNSQKPQEEILVKAQVTKETKSKEIAVETGSKDVPVLSQNNTNIAHKDLREFEIITIDQMNNWIDSLTKYNTSSPFRGRGDVFIKASQESGLDPRYILAHAALESAWGTSHLARTKHNYFGIAAFDSSPNSAYDMGDGLEAGIVNGAKWIANNYTNQGQHTLHLMIYGNKRYASDSQWINKIGSIILKCTA